MKIKIISNIHTLDSVIMDEVEIEICKYPQSNNSVLTIFSYFIKSFKYDYLLLNCSPKDVLILSFLNFILPFNQCRIISLDCILRIPDNLKSKFIQVIKFAAFKKTHIFIEYFKNTKGYQYYYHIKPERFRYIPFKINSYELVLKAKISDQGYIFCGGKTLRDFKTLIHAFKDLPYRLKIVTMDNEEIIQHGSYLDEKQLPPNIEVIRHDGNAETFIQLIAASKFVVLPILKRTIAASGIGVYIACMALKKCVVISSGPSVDKILTDEMAIIVPPEDITALKKAIIKVYEDEKLRYNTAQKGFNYAINLKGEERLKESIMDVIYYDALNNKSILKCSPQ